MRYLRCPNIPPIQRYPPNTVVEHIPQLHASQYVYNCSGAITSDIKWKHQKMKQIKEHLIKKISEGQGFSVGRIPVPLPLPSKIPTLGQGYRFSGGKRMGFCEMVERRRTSLWQMQLSSPWLFPWQKHGILYNV